MSDATTSQEAQVTVGLDLGDRHTQVCVLDEAGEVIEEARVATRPQALRRRFSALAPLRIVLEAGTHSPWVSRLLAELGHEVIVANPRKLRLIYANDSKSDRVDAEYLARVGRLDPALLAPLATAVPRPRPTSPCCAAATRSCGHAPASISHARGTTSRSVRRLPACSTESFAAKAGACVPGELRPALAPVLYRHRAAQRRDPRPGYADRGDGGGALSGDRAAHPGGRRGNAHGHGLRAHPRGPAALPAEPLGGLLPGPAAAAGDSGSLQPQLRITKAGDEHLRWLLVGAAHYILGPFGPDTDLRRWGFEPGRRRAAGPARSGRRWQSPASSPCCSCASGSRARSMSPCATPGSAAELSATPS